MRRVKSVEGLELSCPNCGSLVEGGMYTYVKCGHFMCFSCVTKEGCGQCQRGREDPTSGTCGGPDVSAPPAPDEGGGKGSVVSDVAPPPPPPPSPERLSSSAEEVDVEDEPPSKVLARRKIMERIAVWNIFREGRTCLELIGKNGGFPKATEACTVEPNTGEMKVIGIDIIFSAELSTLHCSKCDFWTKVDLKDDLCEGHRKMIFHILATHSTSFRCLTCGENGESPMAYLKHLRGHQTQRSQENIGGNGSNSESSNTGNCKPTSSSGYPSTSESRSPSSTRASAVFQGAGLYRCLYCHAGFKERSDLQDHISAHHKMPESPQKSSPPPPEPKVSKQNDSVPAHPSSESVPVSAPTLEDGSCFSEEKSEVQQKELEEPSYSLVQDQDNLSSGTDNTKDKLGEKNTSSKSQVGAH